MATVDDNYYDIPFLTGDDTFLDWVNHYNNYTVEKLNNVRIFEGAGGTGISFATGSAGNGITNGTIVVELEDVIIKGVTFSSGVSISGGLSADWSNTLLDDGTIGVRVGHPHLDGFTGISGGFTVGNPVYIPIGGGLTGMTLARANGKTGAEVFGLVSKVVLPTVEAGTIFNSTNTYIEVATNGIIQGDFSDSNFVNGISAGLSSGKVYFLSPGRTGALTTVEPTISGQVSKPVLLGITGDKGFLLNYRGQYLQGTGTGGTGGIDNNRFYAMVQGSHDFAAGDVVGFDLLATDGDAYGWFICNQDNADYIDNRNRVLAYFLDGKILLIPKEEIIELGYN